MNLQRSAANKIIQFAREPKIRLYTITLCYLLSLYFSTNNRIFILFTCIFSLVSWKISKNIHLTLFLTFITILPFAKGKALEVLILPKEQIERYALFKISYYFPVYFSIIPFFLSYYVYVRGKLFNKLSFTLPTTIKSSLIFFVLFSTCNFVNIFLNYQLQDVILFATVQLFVMMGIFFLPFAAFLLLKIKFQYIHQIIAALLTFESLWVLFQAINRGPLGKDIENVIAGQEFGIQAAEHIGFLRLSGTFFEPSILGTFLLMQISLLLFALLKNEYKDSKFNTLLRPIIMLGSIALIFTGSRALYIIAFIILLAILYYFHALHSLYNTTLKRMFILLLLILISPFLISRFNNFSEIFSEYGSASYRMDMMKYAWKLSQNSITGVGLNLSPYYFATAFPYEKFVFDPTYPHNLTFQLLAEVGIIGTVFFYMFIYVTLRNSFSKKGSSLNEKHKITHNVNEFTVASIGFLICAQIYPIFLNHTEILSFFFLYLGLHSYKQCMRNTHA